MEIGRFVFPCQFVNLISFRKVENGTGGHLSTMELGIRFTA